MTQAFYSIATPIGNLSDITTRAVDILSSVDFVVAEDTRHTGQLLAHLGIKKPLLSFRDGPSQVMDRLLRAIEERIDVGQIGAYVTDAGTPGVSDPGWRLMALLDRKGVMASPIPGPSAVTAIMSVVPVPLSEYRFVGFLPKKKGYQTALSNLAAYMDANAGSGIVFFESPHRIRRTLEDFARQGSYYVIIGRELTKKFETIGKGALDQEMISQLPDRGEYVVVLTAQANPSM
jgi:16S rRNA (cytidine1402-2'-O)-methyltransferase